MQNHNHPIGRSDLRDRSRDLMILLVIAIFPACLAVPAAGQSDSVAISMTIPLPEPLSWDPVRASGDYAIIDQSAGLFLLRPTTGRVIAQLSPLWSEQPQPLEIRNLKVPAESRTLSSPPGWPFRPGDEITTTPVVADVDTDGRAEVVFATRTGWLWVLGRDGLPPAGWPVSLGADCHCRPALIDLDADGRLEILVGDAAGRVHALRWNGVEVNGWPARIPGRPKLASIHGAVVAGDLDGDGWIEAIVTQAEGRVCVFQTDGRVAPGWPVATADAEDPPNAGTIFTRVAIGDLNGDGKLEIVSGANNYRVHVWDHTGKPLPGWPHRLPNRGRAGYAEPVLADLTEDGRPEILIPTDQGFDGPARIYALDARGRDAPGWPIDLPLRCNAGVAVGDLDADGHPEVVAATAGDNGWILAWDRRGRRLPEFPARVARMSGNSSPLLADADGDGAIDIILGASGTGFEPAAVLLAISATGRPIDRFPFRLEGHEIVQGGPGVADLNGDGFLELLLGTEVQGQLFVWHLNGSAKSGKTPWPGPGFDLANTGLYRHVAVEETGTPASRPEETAFQGPPMNTPFSPLVSVSFVMLREGYASLIVRDFLGEPIRTLLDTILPVGAYTISWDGTDGHGRSYPPGVYFYRLDTADRCATGQLLLVR